MSFEDDESAIPLFDKHHEDVYQGPTYEPVIPCTTKTLLGLFIVPSPTWGKVKIAFEVIGLLSFIVSTVNSEPRSVSAAIASILLSFVICPIWQNYIDKNESPLSRENGCLLCVGIMSAFGLGHNPNGCVSRVENDPDVSTRFMPFSIYNKIYLITHPGEELNPSLPEYGTRRFGMGRSLLLIYSTSIRGTLNLAMFWHAYYVMKYKDGELLAKALALVPLAIAAIDLRVYLVSFVFGMILYPYMLVVTFAFYFPVCRDILNPPRGSLLFKILTYYWKVASAVES
jgi:hypothetical protein